MFVKEKFSVIIPTLNEGKYLPFLLGSLFRQTRKDFEIIVADAGSKDITVEMAKKLNCKVVKGGSPSRGRNLGARVACGDWLIFLDADVVLPKNFFEKAFKEIKEKHLDCATCFFHPLSDKKLDKVLHEAANLYMRAIKLLKPHAPGFCIFVKKSVFKEIGGFNEKLELAEDHDFVQRASKKGKFGLLKSVKVFVSVRRLEKEGRLKLIIKYALTEVQIIVLGQVYHKLFDYEFGQHH